jgi:hypothetical protein
MCRPILHFIGFHLKEATLVVNVCFLRSVHEVDFHLDNLYTVNPWLYFPWIHVFLISTYDFIRHANFCNWNGIYSLNLRLLFSRISLTIRLDWKYVALFLSFKYFQLEIRNEH